MHYAFKILGKKQTNPLCISMYDAYVTILFILHKNHLILKSPTVELLLSAF